jgi:hypothetical protein
LCCFSSATAFFVTWCIHEGFISRLMDCIMVGMGFMVTQLNAGSLKLWSERFEGGEGEIMDEIG